MAYILAVIVDFLQTQLSSLIKVFSHETQKVLEYGFLAGLA